MCATPGCGQPGEIFDRYTSGMVPKVIQQNFERKGWEIGKNEKHDFCPKCVAQRAADRRAKKIKPISMNGHKAVVPQEAAQMPLMPQTVHAIPPSVSEAAVPEISRADKRVIFAKLEEVYGDEKSGYKTPWTDAAVAKDLGVPQAWVALVREDSFGPVNDNGEIRDMFERMKAYGAEARALLDEAKLIRADGAALVERVNKLAKDATEIGKKLDGLGIICDRVERSLKA